MQELVREDETTLLLVEPRRRVDEDLLRFGVDRCDRDLKAGADGRELGGNAALAEQIVEPR